MKLHTAEIADWDRAGASLNTWQKIAAKSHGVITPANLASFGGAALAIYGLYSISNDKTFIGLVLLATGRLADVADGYIAEYTKTKSPLGETIDATIDKIVVALTLIVFAIMTLVPWVILLVVGLQNIANVLISLVARIRKKKLHPSKLGKISSAYCWATILLYPLGDWLQTNASVVGGRLLILASIISFGVYLIMGLQASLGYADVLYKKPVRKLYRLFK